MDKESAYTSAKSSHEAKLASSLMKKLSSVMKKSEKNDPSKISVVKMKSVSDLKDSIGSTKNPSSSTKIKGKQIGKIDLSMFGMALSDKDESPRSIGSPRSLGSPKTSTPKLQDSPKSVGSPRGIKSPRHSQSDLQGLPGSPKSIGSPKLIDSPKLIGSPNLSGSPKLTDSPKPQESPKMSFTHQKLNSSLIASPISSLSSSSPLAENTSVHLTHISHSNPTSNVTKSGPTKDVKSIDEYDKFSKSERIDNSDVKEGNSSSGSENDQTVKIRHVSKRVDNSDVKRRSIGEQIAEIAQELGLREDDDEDDATTNTQETYKSEISFEISELNKLSNVGRMSKTFAQSKIGSLPNTDTYSESDFQELEKLERQENSLQNKYNSASEVKDMRDQKFNSYEDKTSRSEESIYLQKVSPSSRYIPSLQENKGDSKVYTSTSVNYSPKPNKKLIVKEMSLVTPDISNTKPQPSHVSSDILLTKDHHKDQSNYGGVHLDQSEKDMFRKDLEQVLKTRSQPNSDSDDEEEYDESFLNDRTYAIIAEHALRRGSEKYGFASDDLIDVLSTIMEESDYHGSENVSLCGESSNGGDELSSNMLPSFDVDDALSALERNRDSKESEEFWKKYFQVDNRPPLTFTSNRTAKSIDDRQEHIDRPSDIRDVAHANHGTKEVDVVVKEYEALSQRVDEILQKYRHFRNPPSSSGFESSQMDVNESNEPESKKYNFDYKHNHSTEIAYHKTSDVFQVSSSVNKTSVDKSETEPSMDNFQTEEVTLPKTTKKKTIEEVIKAAEELLSEEDDLDVSRRIRKRKKARRFNLSKWKDNEFSSDDDSVAASIESRASQLSAQFLDKTSVNSELRLSIDKSTDYTKLETEEEEITHELRGRDIVKKEETDIIESFGRVTQADETVKDGSSSSSPYEELNSIASRLNKLKKGNQNIAGELERGHYALDFIRNEENSYQSLPAPSHHLEAETSNENKARHSSSYSYEDSSSKQGKKYDNLSSVSSFDSVFHESSVSKDMESPEGQSVFDEDSYSSVNLYRRRLSRRSLTETSLSPEFKKDLELSRSTRSSEAKSDFADSNYAERNTASYQSRESNLSNSLYEPSYSSWKSNDNDNLYNYESEYRKRSYRGSSCVAFGTESSRDEYSFTRDTMEGDRNSDIYGGLGSRYSDSKDMKAYGTANVKRHGLFLPDLNSTYKRGFGDPSETGTGFRYHRRGQRAKSECRFSEPSSSLSNRFSQRIGKRDTSAFKIQHFETKNVGDYMKSPVFQTKPLNEELLKADAMSSGNQNKINIDLKDLSDSFRKFDRFMRKSSKQKARQKVRKQAPTDSNRRKNQKQIPQRTGERKSSYADVVNDIFKEGLEAVAGLELSNDEETRFKNTAELDKTPTIKDELPSQNSESKCIKEDKATIGTSKMQEFYTDETKDQVHLEAKSQSNKQNGQETKRNQVHLTQDAQKEKHNENKNKVNDESKKDISKVECLESKKDLQLERKNKTKVCYKTNKDDTSSSVADNMKTVIGKNSGRHIASKTDANAKFNSKVSSDKEKNDKVDGNQLGATTDRQEQTKISNQSKGKITSSTEKQPNTVKAQAKDKTDAKKSKIPVGNRPSEMLENTDITRNKGYNNEITNKRKTSEESSKINNISKRFETVDKVIAKKKGNSELHHVKEQMGSMMNVPASFQKEKFKDESGENIRSMNKVHTKSLDKTSSMESSKASPSLLKSNKIPTPSNSKETQEGKSTLNSVEVSGINVKKNDISTKTKESLTLKKAMKFEASNSQQKARSDTKINEDKNIKIDSESNSSSMSSKSSKALPTSVQIQTTEQSNKGEDGKSGESKMKISEVNAWGKSGSTKELDSSILTKAKVFEISSGEQTASITYQKRLTSKLDDDSHATENINNEKQSDVPVLTKETLKVEQTKLTKKEMELDKSKRSGKEQQIEEEAYGRSGNVKTNTTKEQQTNLSVASNNKKSETEIALQKVSIEKLEKVNASTQTNTVVKRKDTLDGTSKIGVPKHVTTKVNDSKVDVILESSKPSENRKHPDDRSKNGKCESSETISKLQHGEQVTSSFNEKLDFVSQKEENQAKKSSESGDQIQTSGETKEDGKMSLDIIKNKQNNIIPKENSSAITNETQQMETERLIVKPVAQNTDSQTVENKGVSYVSLQRSDTIISKIQFKNDSVDSKQSFQFSEVNEMDLTKQTNIKSKSNLVSLKDESTNLRQNNKDSFGFQDKKFDDPNLSPKLKKSEEKQIDLISKNTNSMSKLSTNMGVANIAKNNEISDSVRSVEELKQITPETTTDKKRQGFISKTENGISSSFEKRQNESNEKLPSKEKSVSATSQKVFEKDMTFSSLDKRSNLDTELKNDQGNSNQSVGQNEQSIKSIDTIVTVNDSKTVGAKKQINIGTATDLKSQKLYKIDGKVKKSETELPNATKTVPKQTLGQNSQSLNRKDFTVNDSKTTEGGKQIAEDYERNSKTQTLEKIDGKATRSEHELPNVTKTVPKESVSQNSENMKRKDASLTVKDSKTIEAKKQLNESNVRNSNTQKLEEVEVKARKGNIEVSDSTKIESKPGSVDSTAETEIVIASKNAVDNRSFEKSDLKQNTNASTLERKNERGHGKHYKSSNDARGENDSKRQMCSENSNAEKLPSEENKGNKINEKDQLKSQKTYLNQKREEDNQDQSNTIHVKDVEIKKKDTKKKFGNIESLKGKLSLLFADKRDEKQSSDGLAKAKSTSESVKNKQYSKTFNIEEARRTDETDMQFLGKDKVPFNVKTQEGTSDYSYKQDAIESNKQKTHGTIDQEKASKLEIDKDKTQISKKTGESSGIISSESKKGSSQSKEDFDKSSSKDVVEETKRKSQASNLSEELSKLDKKTSQVPENELIHGKVIESSKGINKEVDSKRLPTENKIDSKKRNSKETKDSIPLSNRKSTEESKKGTQGRMESKKTSELGEVDSTKTKSQGSTIFDKTSKQDTMMSSKSETKETRETDTPMKQDAVGPNNNKKYNTEAYKKGLQRNSNLNENKLNRLENSHQAHERVALDSNSTMVQKVHRYDKLSMNTNVSDKNETKDVDVEAGPHKGDHATECNLNLEGKSGMSKVLGKSKEDITFKNENRPINSDISKLRPFESVKTGFAASKSTVHSLTSTEISKTKDISIQKNSDVEKTDIKTKSNITKGVFETSVQSALIESKILKVNSPSHPEEHIIETRNEITGKHFNELQCNSQVLTKASSKTAQSMLSSTDVQMDYTKVSSKNSTKLNDSVDVQRLSSTVNVTESGMKTLQEDGSVQAIDVTMDKTEKSDKSGEKSCSDSVFESESMSEQSVITIKQDTSCAVSVPNGDNEKDGSASCVKAVDRRLDSTDDRESGYYSKLQIDELDRSQSVRDSVNSWLDKYVPMTREPSKAYEYKVIEEDFSLPNRTYIDHLTTYIPPRLPIEKPDLFTMTPETATLSWKPAKVPDRIRNTCNLTYSIEVRNPPGLDWRELVSGLTSTNYDLKNLHPRLDYLFRIRAHNEYGCSEPCLPVSLHRPIELSDDEFDIDDWDDPYRISLGQLAPPKLPMEAPRITDNGVTAHLSWFAARIPAYAKKTPITYIVEIKEPNIPGWSRVSSGITDTNYFVEDLLPNKDYQFRVKAETQFGVSDPTLPVSLERSKNQKRQSVDYRKEDGDFEVSPKPSFSGGPPRMPSSRPLIYHRHGNSISLSWNPGRVPSYVKNSKLTYVVEVREPPSPLWRVLADNLTDNDFDINNLVPDQDYMFRVRAKNDFGLSEPTLPASVFREKDDYTPTLSRSRSGSASPWVGGSRASSVDRQRSFSLTDDDLDVYINRDRKPCPPEFKTPVETTQYGVEGRSAKLTLPLRGYPLPRVSWFYMGERLEYGDLFKASVSPAGVASLDIQMMSQERAGDYKCCVENEHGVAVKIVRLLLADQPTIIEPMKNLSLGTRGSGKLECRVDGIPYPTVKFLKDLRPVVGSSRVKVDHTPPDLWTLSIEGAMSMDAGMYTCIAENMAGKVSSVAKVTITDEDEEDSETVTMDTPIKEKFCEEDYYVLEEIGRGRHGVVRRVVDKITGGEYAAKFIPVADEKQRQFFMHESRNLRSFDHKGVPRVVDLYQTERRLVIVMDIITGGNILSYVIRRKNQIEEDVAYYVEQLLLILKYLHSNNILHLDIKPSSVHFIEEGSDNICLLDFGFSRNFSKDKDVHMNFGSVDFTSPEQISNDRVTPATDLWNVGLLVHTLLSGESPFHDKSESETLLRIQECDWSIDEDAFDGISTEARDFITKLLIKEPSKRMSLADCLNHPFIKGDCEDGQGQKLNTDRLRAFSKTLRERKSRHLLQTTANLVSLRMILDNKDTMQPVLRGQSNEAGNITYPESSAYGEFLDDESWFDWQSRSFGGDDDSELQTDSQPVWRDPAVLKEEEWSSVADDYKQQIQKPQDFFPKEEMEDDNPQFLTKLGNLLFRPGEDITLSCRVAEGDSLTVSWYRNEELLSESNRIKLAMSDSGEASLVVCAAKPYDDGLYKCVVRSKTGKSSTWARVLVGELPSQPCRPIVTQISSRDALLLWESPTTDADIEIKHYRIDYKAKGTEEWLIGGYTVDQMALVSGLEADTSYQFRVCASNTFGSGPYSVSSLPTKTLKDDAEEVELEPLETILLSKQNPQKHETMSCDLEPKELTLKEENVESVYSISKSYYRGQFSEFFLAKEAATNKSFMSRQIIQSDSNRDTIQRELELLRLCQSNQRILRLLDCFLYNSKVYFIHEYFCGVNIVEHFAFKTKYSEDMVAMAMQQVLDGVQFLHQNNIVHLNLQPSSIVMRHRSSLDVRITDFTLAQKLESKDGIEVPINGNPEFLAPEVVVQEKVSYPADIWTVGTLAFLLLSGESPYYGKKKDQMMSNIAYNRYNPLALYENITRDALRFIFKVLKRTPRNRMTADECLEDRWLQGKDSIVKARQEATFTTVKLRTYVERTLTDTDEDALPTLKELRKMFELSEDKRHRFRVPERSFDAEELEKKETRITLKSDETVNQTDQSEPKETDLTIGEVKDSTAESDDKDDGKDDDKDDDAPKKSGDRIEQVADDLVSTAVKEALHSGEISAKDEDKA